MAGDDRLAEAYRNVFLAHTEDAHLVLNDLAQYTGFYSVLPADVSDDQLRYREGARAAFARVFEFLSQTNQGVAALDKAARKGK